MKPSEGELIIFNMAERFCADRADHIDAQVFTASLLHFGLGLAILYPEYAQAVLSTVRDEAQAELLKLAEDMVNYYPIQVRL